MSEVQHLETLELVTLQGEVIEIEFPDSVMDELLGDFNEACQRRDWWNVGNWCDAKAIYKGRRLDTINMAQIIGTQ